LAGDADSDILLSTLDKLYPDDTIRFEIVKLPHHGSRNNLTGSLVKKIDSPHYMLTGGKTSEGPHWEALAKIITRTLAQGVEQHTIHVNGYAGVQLLSPVWEGKLDMLLNKYYCKFTKENEVTFEY
jgi:hypothetical protein